jgi:hypothetical protein
VVRETCLQSAPLFQAKHIKFENDLPNRSIAVKGDAQALRRLFLILIDNAVKYTPSDGSVQVSACETNSTAVVTVADTGIGIPPEDLPTSSRASTAWTKLVPASKVVRAWGRPLAAGSSRAMGAQSTSKANPVEAPGSRLACRLIKSWTLVRA